MESKPYSILKDYEILIADNYVLDARKKIDSGAFGVVYSGKILEKDIPIAIKLEQKGQKHLLLKKEVKIYKMLEGIEKIPKIYWSGSQGNYNCLIMDLLGPSLKSIMKKINKPFSLGTTLKISIQILNILEKIHKKGIVLRYIKPGNIVIGKGINKDSIYLIDFGLAKRYIKHGKHISYIKNKKEIKGNLIFISVNALSGNQISRRDDIECLGYNLINFMKGKLPWSESNKNYIRGIKINTTLDELCEGLPDEFKEFIKYGKEMEFEQEPDYKYLNGLLMQVAKKNKIDINNIKYDWDIYIEDLSSKKQKEKEAENINNERQKEIENANNEKQNEKDIENANNERQNEKEIENANNERQKDKEEESVINSCEEKKLEVYNEEEKAKDNKSDNISNK